MPTSTLGGHVDTLEALPVAGRRRLHSDEFKADSVAAASLPGMSMASVALARGINANLLRRWERETEMPPTKVPAKDAPAASTFVPVASTGTGDRGTWRAPFHLLRHVLEI